MPSKSMGHLALGTSLGTRLQRLDRRGQQPLGPAGVARRWSAGGRVYTIDTLGTVRAFDVRRPAARCGAASFGADSGNGASLYGGGVAFDDGRVYATNGLGLSRRSTPATGGVVWQVRPGGPLRGAPTVADGTLYVISQDNQIYSLKAADGTTNWSNAAALEIAGVFGSAAPAVGAGHGRRRLLVGRAQRLSLRERPPGVAGRACRGPACRPASSSLSTSTPTR